MGAVHQELLDAHVQLFVSTLAPHSLLPPDKLRRPHRRGEALSVMMIGGQCSEREAAGRFPR